MAIEELKELLSKSYDTDELEKTVKWEDVEPTEVEMIIKIKQA